MSHARNGDEFQTAQHRGSPANIEVLAIVILVNPNPSKIHEPWHAIMEWHQHARVKNIVPFGAGYGTSFSQTRASHKKTHGSIRETCHHCGQNDIRRLFLLSIFSLVST